VDVLLGEITLNKRQRMLARDLLLLTPLFLTLFVLALHFTQVFAQEPTAIQAAGAFDILGAGLAVGLCGIGAGLAIYGSTSAGSAAMVERPELTTWVLVFAGLGEGIAIYGLVVAILILGR
jgi:V/A-type H+-transporting ATPase subunit K